MEWQMWFTMISVGLMFVMLAKTRIPPEWICLGTLILFLVTGILTDKEAVEGASNQGMLTVAILFVVAGAFTETGAIQMLTFLLSPRIKSRPAALIRMMAPVTVLSAFLNNTPVVAIFIPAVKAWAKKIKVPVSKLMIPLSYSAIFGGTCTLIGTSTNLVVSGVIQKELGVQLGLFEIAKVGVPFALIMFVVVTLLSLWLLPDRSSAIDQMGDPKQYTTEMIVPPGSVLIGKTLRQAELTEENEIHLIEIIRGKDSVPATDYNLKIEEDDRLVFGGIMGMISEVQKVKGLTPVMDRLFKIDTPRPDRCFVEAVVSNSNRFIDRSIVGNHFRQIYDAVVVAISRGGEQISGSLGSVVLKEGDTLLLETNPSFYERNKNSQDFHLISQLEESATPRYNKAILSCVVLVGMIFCATFFDVGMFKAAVVAAAILLVTRCISFTSAYKSVDMQVLLVIIAAFGIGKAMEKTGAAAFIATQMVSLGGGSPWMVLSMLYLTTSVLTEMVTNNAAALILWPIAFAMANQMGVSWTPFAFAIMMGASASFATPIGYQCNMMVFGPGGYRFSDFLKIGIPMNLIAWVLMSIMIPLVWAF
ncbi:MAG: SLC13 family permease [Proteobacteria bacterium]|nr:SLC13 family permease [Pseudomonadota bacterium]MBU4471863.1 SLC13 family permease [Pseudomonadota bacterium]MCG2750641.1 SLC13 family permease [Desulfobacteraceae bacterium]